MCVIPPLTPCEAAASRSVFRGIVTEVNPIAATSQPGLPPPPPEGMRYRFRVMEDFSGAALTSVELVRWGMMSCDRDFVVGAEYVVYAAQSRSASAAPNEFPPEANADLRYLRGASTSSPEL